MIPSFAILHKEPPSVHFGTGYQPRLGHRQWRQKEETEFHRIVAWNKLAELCNQLCAKGRRIYVEGRLQTRQWTGQDGQQRQATEIVIEDMILLDSSANRPRQIKQDKSQSSNAS